MKNEFDDNLKKKWEQFHFSVDDQHRHDMIRLLDENKRRKTGLFWWLGGSAIIIGVAAALIFMKSPSEAIEQGPSNPHQTQISTLHANSNSTSSQQVPKMELQQSNGTINEPNDQKVGNNPNETSLKNNSTHQGPDNLSKINQGKNTKNTLLFATNDQIHNSASAIDQSKENSEITGIEIVNENESTEAVNRNTEQLQPYRDVTFITVPIEDLPLNPLDYSRRIIDPITPSFATAHTFRLFAEAGFGFVPGVKTHFSPGWTINAGGGLSYKVNERDRLSFSTGYFMQKDGFDFDRTSTVQSASFGARSSFHSLSPDKLHFVYGRIGIHHRMRRQMLSLFGGTQYLYGAQGSITRQTQDELTGYFQETKYAWLKLDGMQRLLWNTELAYGYQLTPSLSLHAGVKYYFSKIEAVDPELETDGYYWNGRFSAVNPFLTINYQLYEN